MVGFLKRIFQRRKKTATYLNLTGKLYIGFSLLVAFAAVNTGNNVLYIVLSFLLSSMIVSGFLAVYNLRRLEVDISPPEEVWCCKDTPFGIFITNLKRFPSFLIDLWVGERKKSFPLVEEKVSGELPLRFEKRGIHRLKEVYLESSFPFGLISRVKEINLDREIVVFPQPKELKIHLFPSKGSFMWESGYLSVRLKRGDTVEGVKDYEGEGLRLVNWKVFARLGELYAKRLSSEVPIGEVIVDLNSVPGDNFEEQISHATYLVLKFHKRGFAVGIRYGAKEIPPSYGWEHLRYLLRFLALV